MLVLQGLAGWLALQHEGRIIAAQEAPPSPGALRNGIKPSAGDAIRSPDPEGFSEPRETTPEPPTMVACQGRRQPYRHRHLIRFLNRQVTFLLNA